MTVTPSPRVSVVVPSWNGRAWLDVVLPSLERQRFRDFEVIVVDNGSTDGSLEHVRARWPWAQVLPLDRNVGFAAAVNRGIEQSQGVYVALVNNDMELHESFLDALVAGLDSNPSAASVTAKMLDLRTRDLIDGAGDVLRWSGVVIPRGRGERDIGQYETPVEVFSACGGAALYRRAAFDEVGLFDEAFFAQMEDVDWGFRARLLGYGCRYVPGAVAYHMGSASMRREGRPIPGSGAAGAQLHLDVDEELSARLPAAQRASAARARAGRPLLRDP